jgi:formylglycine-generating enzyme required for sulfatase activity
MKRWELILILFTPFLIAPAFGQCSILLDFSGDSAEANHVSLMGAGFGTYPQADVSFGPIPTDNLMFENSTDGKGMIIQADPGEGVMILTQSIQTTNCALIRCSVRADASHASVYLASVDQGVGTFVSTITPNNGKLFVNQYKRLADFFLPPSTGFQGIIQVTNTSSTEKLTAYLDNLEILNLENGAIDLAVTEITGKELAAVGTPTPVPPTPTPTNTPTPTPGFTQETITVNLSLPDGVKPLEMVLIPAGTFTMGSPSSEKNRKSDETQHQVTLTTSFYLGKYEITQAQWKAVVGNNPSGKLIGNDLPVERVNWDDCQLFIRKLNKLGQGTFGLPTEAEWEYACRAGTKTAYYWGDDSSQNQIEQYEWYESNSGLEPQKVGSKLSNPWGLFDMGGNVFEWCQDLYGSYGSNAQTDPTGGNSGSNRVHRGGSWISSAADCRPAHRDYAQYDSQYLNLGFRLRRSYP